MPIDTLIQSVLSNPVSAGLGSAALLGGAMYQLRRIPTFGSAMAKRHFTVTMQLISGDQSFEWIDNWLSEQPYVKKARVVALRAKAGDDTGPEDDYYDGPGEVKKNEWMLTPGSGWHLFMHRGRPVWVTRRMSDVTPSYGQTKPIEHLSLTTIGRSQKVMRDIVIAAHAAIKKDPNQVDLKTWNGRWVDIQGKRPRPLETVILHDGQLERIIDDIERFAGARDWYAERGIPYRRGYLFYGPPGTGKTSTVFALAAAVKRPLCLLNLSGIATDDILGYAIQQAPSNAIILLEDIDCVSSAKTRKGQNAASIVSDQDADEPVVSSLMGISKAGLLNALDGITTPDGRIVIMTTNHPEKLDHALVRPGRADVKELFDYFGADEQRRMAERFYGVGKFHPVCYRVSPATMQAAFMKFPTDPDRAEEELRDSVEIAKIA
jgi:chaperone BCS1